MDDRLIPSVSNQVAGEASPLVGFRQRHVDTAGVRGRFQRKDDEEIVDAMVGN